MATGNGLTGGKAKRNRSFGGCSTCRSRRLKCDEAQPECTHCRTAGLTCGYEKSLFFETDDVSQKGGSARYRRTLLTIEQRACMSAQITSCIPPPLALWTIGQIDEICEEACPSQGLDIQRGPFGAFKVQSAATTSTENVEAPRLQEILPTQEDCVDASEPTWSDETQEAIAMLFQDCGFTSPSERIQEVLGDISSPSTSEEDHSYVLEAAPRLQQQEDVTAISRISTPLNFAQVDIPQGSWVLLKHYLHTVLKSLTPFRHSKTPWHTLFVPLVKNCLAGLALQEDVDHASRCVFFGTLAISAASLGGTSQSPEWQRKSDIYRQQAQAHINASIATAYDTPKSTKYKTQLMAVLTMVQVSSITGTRDETEYYLLEAEKLIRLRGLNRRKSRKVRLLHHCYAYERIFFESTLRGKCTQQYHHSIRKAIESSGASAYSQDSPSFQMPTFENLEIEMLRVKSQDQGENDLHLQYPGVWPSTLYPEIFGVPEHYVFLVSMIVRLGRERDIEAEDGQTGGLGLKSFSNRAKAIEKCIKQQRCLPYGPNPALEHLIEAIHHAVLVFFYRRIYDLDASMLQQQVTSIRDCLLRYESVNTEQASVRLIWPAFVAACEADEPELQTFFAQLFDKFSRQTGLRIFDAKLAEIEQIWQSRRNDLGADMNYMSLVLDDYQFM